SCSVGNEPSATTRVSVERSPDPPPPEPPSSDPHAVATVRVASMAAPSASPGRLTHLRIQPPAMTYYRVGPQRNVDTTYRTVNGHRRAALRSLRWRRQANPPWWPSGSSRGRGVTRLAANVPDVCSSVRRLLRSTAAPTPRCAS